MPDSSDVNFTGKPFRSEKVRLPNPLISTILDNLTDAFFIINKNWKVVYGNKKAEQVAGMKREVGIGKLFWDLFPEAKDSPFHQQYSKAFLTQQPTHFEAYFEPLKTWFDMSVYPSKDMLSIYARDITEEKKLQEELTEERITREKKVTQATLLAQEKEREYIGLELHDNINQILASVKLLLETARTNKAMRLELIAKSRDNIIEVISEIRKLTKGLVAPIIRDLRFIEAVKELTSPYSTSKAFEVDFSCSGPIEQLSYDIKLSLFRIIQEGLTNITKYACAKHVSINLSCSDSVQLTIKDDGIGFDPGARREGIGISNIRNRAELCKGSVQITSSAGKGCILQIEIPLEQ